MDAALGDTEILEEPMSGKPPRPKPAPLSPVGGEATNGDCVAGPPSAAVIFVHRAGDTGPGAQAEVNNAFNWGGRFDEALGKTGARVEYPTFDALSEARSAAADGSAVAAAAARCADRVRAHVAAGVAPAAIFVGGFDGGGAVALALAAVPPACGLGGVFALEGGRGLGAAAACAALERAGPAARPLAVALGLEARAAAVVDDDAATDDDDDGEAAAPAAPEARLVAALEATGAAVDVWRVAAALPVGAGAVAVRRAKDGGGGDEARSETVVGDQLAEAAHWLLARLPAPPPAPAPAPKRVPAAPDLHDRYKVRYLLKDLARGMSRAVFDVPAGSEKLLAKYPINCRGSGFEMIAAGSGKVATEFYSPEPDATAAAIAARITVRLKDPESAGGEACAIA